MQATCQTPEIALETFDNMEYSGVGMAIILLSADEFFQFV